jgi:hypothetical protein
LEADADFHLGLTVGYTLVEHLLAGSDHTEARREGSGLAWYPIVVHGGHFCKRNVKAQHNATDDSEYE